MSEKQTKCGTTEQLLSKKCFLLFQDQYRYSSKKCKSKEISRPEYTPRPPPGGPTRDYTNFIILGVILLVIIIIVIVVAVVFCKACMKPGANSRTNQSNKPRRRRSEGPMSSTNLKRVNSWHSIHDGCIDNDEDDPNARFVVHTLMPCPPTIVTDQSSVLPFCPNRTEQVNQSSVSRTETEQNLTCKRRIKT